jgi:hypothetical protein
MLFRHQKRKKTPLVLKKKKTILSPIWGKNRRKHHIIDSM